MQKYTLRQKELLALGAALFLAYAGLFLYGGYILGSSYQEEQCLMELRYRDAKIRYNLTAISNNENAEFSGNKNGVFQLVGVYDENGSYRMFNGTLIIDILPNIYINKKNFLINPIFPK